MRIFLLLLACTGCQTAANPVYDLGRIEDGRGGNGGRAGTGGGTDSEPMNPTGQGGAAVPVSPAAPTDAGNDTQPSADAAPTEVDFSDAAPTEVDFSFTGDVTKGLALYLPLDERPGTSVASDASGKNASAQLRSIDPDAAWTVRAAGKALALQGTSWNGWVDVNGSSLASVISGNFTVALWVRRPAGGASGTEMLVARTSLGARGPLFALGLEAGVLTAQMNTTAAYNLRLKANGTVPTDRWVHVALTYDVKQVRLYVEGLTVGAGQYAQAIPLDTTSFMIGGLEQANRNVASRFGGEIDEVLLYTRVLTPTEVDGLAKGARPQPR